MSHGCVTLAIVALLAVAPHVALAKPAKRAAHPAAKKASPAPPATKERAPSGSSASAASSAGSATSESSSRASSSSDGDGESSQGGAESATTTTTTPGGGKVKSKTYTFGAMDVEGKLKTPQLLYFLNRVRLELDMSAPDKRSFMKELQQSADDKNL
jgi:hypothetical protein